MLKVQLSLLAVALMLVCTATESPSWPLLTNPNMSVRACGKRLTQLLQLICGGKYNPLYSKKSMQGTEHCRIKIFSFLLTYINKYGNIIYKTNNENRITENQCKTVEIKVTYERGQSLRRQVVGACH